MSDTALSQEQTTTEETTETTQTVEQQAAAEATNNQNQVMEVKFPENWKDGLGEFKEDASLKTIHSVQDLAKSYVNAQKLIGKEKVVIPDWKHATEEDVTAFYKKVGLVPETSENYELEVGEDADETVVKSYKETVHKLNMSPKQAQGLLEWYQQAQQQIDQQMEEAQLSEISSELESYKKERGAAYQRDIGYARNVIKEFGDDHFAALMDTSLGNSPAMIKFLSKIGEQVFGEEGFKGGDSRSYGLSPDEAKSRWESIQKDKEHPYWNSKHANHKQAVKEVKDLFEYMFENA